jgi:hypothetical protein
MADTDEVQSLGHCSSCILASGVITYAERVGITLLHIPLHPNGQRQMKVTVGILRGVAYIRSVIK